MNTLNGPAPTAEEERLLHQLKLAFDILAGYGVPKERAKSVHNGIHVLSSRYEKEMFFLNVEINEANRKISELTQELETLRKKYDRE